jgi:hypothetical protein
MTFERKSTHKKQPPKTEHTRRYYNSQRYLDEHYNVQHPETLRALVVSIGYEQMYNLPLSRTTDLSLRQWIEQIIEFMEVYWISIDPETFELFEYAKQNKIWQELMDGDLDNKVRGWQILSKSQKIQLFERLRHVNHQAGSILAELYNISYQEAQTFLDELSFVLN